MKMHLKQAVWLLSLSLLISLLGNALAQEELSGTITMYPQSYYSTAARPEAALVVEGVIADYNALHPNLTVELIDDVGGGSDFVTWFTTRLAAGQAPNVSWRQFFNRNREGSEVWVPLNEYLEGPNHYVPEGQPGSERWADLFPDYVMAQTRAGDGNWYQVSMDWVETGLFLNDDALASAGVEADWSNWSDFIADCGVLRAAGIEPVGVFMTPGWSTYQWLDTIFLSAAYGDIIPDWYLPQYSSELLPFRQLNPEELALAIKEGKFSVDDERFDAYLDITKEFADACLIEGFAGIADLDEVVRLFVEGEVAMGWFGVWNIPTLAEINFDSTITYLPPITKADVPFTPFEDTSFRVGGPSSAGQWGITQATADAGLLEEAIDFLMYWSAPQVFQKVYDEFPTFIPMVAGTEASDAANQFRFVAAMPERGITDAIGRLTPEYGTDHNRLFQQFMLGEIDAEQLKTRYQPILEQAVEDLCFDQEWELCN